MHVLLAIAIVLFFLVNDHKITHILLVVALFALIFWSMTIE
jgi:hypothetical protein